MPERPRAVKRAVVLAAVRQFGNPRGVAGRIAGWVMAHRSSNRRRNSWVVSLLDVRPTDRVLEVGFGPGVAIAELSRRVGPEGHVHGIDRSDVMLRQATSRNAAAIRAGRVTLTRATVEELPPAVDGPFDAVLAVNSLAFWTTPGKDLEELRRRLAPGGRIAIASQPRHAGVTRDPELAARENVELLRSAGFTDTRAESLPLDPPVVCVLGFTEASSDRSQDR
ncbi:class I SAM-dependent methyltransferase [Streptomyces sp. NPDC059063]|uniref:class I SAM-dependent methyltransferase n=1 Tax=unclassified Streptomyces TaxID=2593676 RepID=UPI0036C24B5F